MMGRGRRSCKLDDDKSIVILLKDIYNPKTLSSYLTCSFETQEFLINFLSGCYRKPLPSPAISLAASFFFTADPFPKFTLPQYVIEFLTSELVKLTHPCCLSNPLFCQTRWISLIESWNTSYWHERKEKTTIFQKKCYSSTLCFSQKDHKVPRWNTKEWFKC